MTDEEECIEYLLSQCPAFAPHWKEHRAPYGHEPTPGGLMLVKFVLVLNLKTAKAFGLTIPPSLLLHANEVIE